MTGSSGSRTATSLDDDPARIANVTAAVAYLAHESDRALGRTLEEMEAIVAEATRVVGLYAPDGAMVGFARVISDRVKVLRGSATCTSSAGTSRGRPRGRRSRCFTIEESPLAGLRWLSAPPVDAHGLYEPLGFGTPSASVMERPPRR